MEPGSWRAAADRRTWDAVLAARTAAVSVRRTAELAGISPDTVQRWTQGATRGETGPARARTPQPFPGLDLDDADTAFVVDSALREFAARMRGEAEDSEIDARDDLVSAEAAEAHLADAAKRRRWAEIAETVLDRIDP